MILNKDKVLKLLIEFIKNYALNNGKKHLILEHSKENEISKVLIELCYKTKLPVTILTEGKDIVYNDIPHFSIKPTSDLKLWKNSINYTYMRQAASQLNGIIVDWITKEHYETRAYSKNCIGDILPFADLFYSELVELFSISKNYKIKDFESKDLEWAWRENSISNIIFDVQDPVKNKDWGRFTLEQRKLVTKLHQIEKLTKHKRVLAPICYLRHIPGLVR